MGQLKKINDWWKNAFILINLVLPQNLHVMYILFCSHASLSHTVQLLHFQTWSSASFEYHLTWRHFALNNCKNNYTVCGGTRCYCFLHHLIFCCCIRPWRCCRGFFQPWTKIKVRHWVSSWERGYLNMMLKKATGSWLRSELYIYNNLIFRDSEVLATSIYLWYLTVCLKPLQHATTHRMPANEELHNYFYLFPYHLLK